MNTLAAIIRKTLAVIAAVSLMACGAIVVTGVVDEENRADLAVVLGNKVEPDGTPSPALRARLDHTVVLYRHSLFKQVLVSGAHGTEGYDEPAVMRRYLEGNGIPHEVIFEDNTGFTTWDTARNTAQFLRDHHLRSVLVVSQYFHMARCRLVFSKFGIGPVYTSHAPLWSWRDFYSVPREVVGCIVYYWRSVDQVASPTIPTGRGSQ